MSATSPSIHQEASFLTWSDAQGQSHRSLWHSEARVAVPGKFQLADDTLTADKALRLAAEGTALIWQGDFHNAKQLLQAMGRRWGARSDRSRKARAKASPVPVFPHAFHLHRQAMAQRAQVLGRLLVPLTADFEIPLRRAPNVKAALAQAWASERITPDATKHLLSLRELLGLIGAYEWRRQGVEIPALGGTPTRRIHPYYGVFSPIRGEYIDLVAQAPLPTPSAGADGLRALEVGVGTGVLSAVLAKRGVQHITGTDLDPRALACAAENLQRLGYADRVSLRQADLFPSQGDAFQAADLVLCNPPWLPGRPSSPIEAAIYDPNSQMLKSFLAQVKPHLTETGEAWLVLSDLAEHLGLRTRDELLGWIQQGGLRVLGRLDARPQHPKAMDSQDPLHGARSREITSLWRLGRGLD